MLLGLIPFAQVTLHHTITIISKLLVYEMNLRYNQVYQINEIYNFLKWKIIEEKRPF